MFKWLNSLFTGKKKKDTEVRELKEEALQVAAKCRALAQQGDPKAQQRLKKLEETITEQSIRLTGKPKPPTTYIPGVSK